MHWARVIPSFQCRHVFAQLLLSPPQFDLFTLSGLLPPYLAPIKIGSLTLSNDNGNPPPVPPDCLPTILVIVSVVARPRHTDHTPLKQVLIAARPGRCWRRATFGKPRPTTPHHTTHRTTITAHGSADTERVAGPPRSRCLLRRAILGTVDGLSIY